MELALNTDQSITLHSSVAALSVPTGAGDGQDVTAWRAPGDATRSQGGLIYVHRETLIEISVSAAITLTGPVLLHGYRAIDSLWREIAVVSSASLVLLATGGFARLLEGAGLFDRLAVSSNGQVGIGDSTVRATPVDSIDR